MKNVKVSAEKPGVLNVWEVNSLSVKFLSPLEMF